MSADAGLAGGQPLSQTVWDGYRAVKGMMAAMGHPVGPPRPPTLPVDDQEIAEAREILKGIGWPVAG